MAWKGLSKPKCIGGMGFRNLLVFNRALLAKQGWPIIHFPNSLLAQVLKSRYFKHYNVMEAGLGSNASFVWRSIMWSRDLIKKGLCWRVGNGKSLNISGFKSCANNVTDHSLKMSNLITNAGCWNDIEVRHLFPPSEVEAILGICLNRSGCEDIRFWKERSKGTYTVKSIYFLEMKSLQLPNFQIFTSRPRVVQVSLEAKYPS